MKKKRKKKYKLSKYFLNQSPAFLYDWLEDKNNKYKSKEKRKAIAKLIPKKMEDVYLFREQILFQNPLHRLAILQLHKEGKAEKVIINNEVKFNYDAGELVEKIAHMVGKGASKQQLNNLRNYMKWEKL